VIDVNPLFAIGTTDDIIARVREYVAAGASKFVMFPIAAGDKDTFDQTRRIIEEVMPAVEN